MKKFSTSLLLALTFTLCLAFTSCNKKEGSNNAPQTSASTPAQILCQQFKEAAKTDSSISLEDLANSLVSNEIIPFGPAVMPVEEGYLNGFSSEINGFSEGMMFGPMIGSIPFIGYLFRSDDVNTLIANLKDKADLRWNVCTQADEMVVDSVKNLVFFAMSPINFDQE